MGYKSTSNMNMSNVASEQGLSWTLSVHVGHHLPLKPLFSHLSLDKMAAISQTIFQMHFREWKVLYFDSNFTEVCSQESKKWLGDWPIVPIDNIPLSESVLTQFTDAYMRHSEEMS